MNITKMINDTKEQDGQIWLMGDTHLLKKERDKPRITLNKNYWNSIENISSLQENDMLIFMGDFIDDTIDEQLFRHEMEIFERVPILHKVWLRGNNDIFCDSYYKMYGFDIAYSALYETETGFIVFSHTSIDVHNNNNIINCHGHMHNSGAEMLYYHDPTNCINLAQNLADGNAILLDDIYSYRELLDDIYKQYRWYPGNEKPGMSMFVKNMATEEFLKDLKEVTL